MDYIRLIFVLGFLMVSVRANELPPVPVSPAVVLQPVTPGCLACICQASSNCNVAEKCVGDVCGPYKMTWAYWVDGGRHTVFGESPYSKTAYENCANDVTCAAETVQGYVRKFNQDCNGDGVADCQDHAAIHYLGGYDCKKPLPPLYAQNVKHCLTHQQFL